MVPRSRPMNMNLIQLRARCGVKDRRSKAKLIILLGIIWVIITLPLPWIINNPQVSEDQFNTILGIIGVMSIPFIMLGVVWTLKPELTT